MNSPTQNQPTQLFYRPEVFEVGNEQAAKQIILTTEDGVATDERWRVETPYIVDRICKLVNPSPDQLGLDIGCGIGRVSRGLIERTGCSMMGTDISRSMRQLAPGYVVSERFTVMAPSMLDSFSQRGARADFAIAVWVLQHIPVIVPELERLHAAMAVGAKLFVVNNHHRAIPTNAGWANDGVDMRALLSEKFKLVHEENLPLNVSTPSLTQNSFVAVFERTA